jgi:DNA-binding response OmpR family regulator
VRATVLLVEDEPAIAQGVARLLEEAGLAVTWVEDAAQARQKLELAPPDLIILDLRLPDESGLALCREVRQSSIVPILILTALGSTSEKVAGFAAGADDYVVKPFEGAELVARVEALLRRVGRLERPVLTRGDLWIDPRSYTVRWGGRPVDLSPREVEVLHLLASQPNRAFTRGQILDRVWGEGADVDLRAVDACITRLRRKLQEAQREGEEAQFEIETVWGIGYKFRVG